MKDYEKCIYLEKLNKFKRNRMNRKITYVVIISMAFVFGGNAYTENSEKHVYSGFLSDYKNFKVINPKTNAEVWIKPPHQDFTFLKKYNSVVLSPIEIWMDPSSYRGIDPNELKLITDYFFKSLRMALDPDYSIVEKSGPNVMNIRIAITGVQKKKPNNLKVINLLPVKLAWEAGNAAYRGVAGKQLDIYSASLELEILDSESGERLAAVVDTHESSKTTTEKGEDTWAPLQEVLDYWVQIIHARLDESHAN